MRYVRIFILHLQGITTHRSRSFVWFIVTLINPLIMVIFWFAALPKGKSIVDWQFSTMMTYYLLLAVASAFIVSHVEEDVSFRDIQEGRMSNYLIKPFSYFTLKWISESSYRILQGFYGIIILVALLIIFKNVITLDISFSSVFFILLSLVLANIISYIYKICLGLLAFWVTEIDGLFNLLHMIFLIFAGYVMPLHLFPHSLQNIAFVLPFSYMIYFPVVMIQGRLPFAIPQVIGIQIFWVIIGLLVFRLLWSKGIKKFQAVGQ